MSVNSLVKSLVNSPRVWGLKSGERSERTLSEELS